MNAASSFAPEGCNDEDGDKGRKIAQEWVGGLVQVECEGDEGEDRWCWLSAKATKARVVQPADICVEC